MWRWQGLAGKFAERAGRSGRQAQTVLRPLAAASSCSAAGFFIYKNYPTACEANIGQTGMSSEGYMINMPLDLVLVRHGQSEANIMIEMKEHGDMSGQEKMDKVGRHDSMMRLTDKGRQQARDVGAWVAKNIGQFDRFYVSEYVRTKETAACMNLPGGHWCHDMMIRERDQGVQDGQGDVKMGLSDDEVHRVKKSPMYWAPIGGESMSDVCQRVRLFLQRLQLQATGLRAVVVCHYRTIHAFRMLIEDTKQGDYESLLGEKMPNCCIWWYSRRDDSGRVHLHFVSCKRIAVKPDGTAEIISFPVRPGAMTNADLLTEVGKVSQVLNNP